MTAPVLKTKSEQKLEYLMGLRRPLTDRESDELRRSMHAAYECERRQRHVAQCRNEEVALLKRLRSEAAQPEWYPHQ